MSRARHKSKGKGSFPQNASFTTEADSKSKVVKEIGSIGGMPGKKNLAKRAMGGRANATSSPMAPGSASHPYSSACCKGK